MAASMQGLPRSNLSRIIRLLSSNGQVKVQSRRSSQSSSSQKHPEDDDIDISQVIIPKRKHREPTAILRALSATVELDTTGPDFSFIDDPYFTNFEHHNKKMLMQAKGAGRRAARYIIDNNPKGFVKYRQYPERNLPTCAPKPVEYKFKDPSEEALKERIDMRKVSDAKEMYDFLRSTGDEISLNTKLDLLDLFCVYNCRELPIDAIDVEKLFSKFHYEVFTQPSWRKHNHGAEILFQDLTEKPARAYNTLLQGRAEYANTEGAQGLYDHMIATKIPVSVESYNALIRSYKNTESMKPVEKLLQDMASNGVKPTVKTFEAVLGVLMSTQLADKSFAIKTLNEMKKLNIEPNLGCLRCLLNVVYRSRISGYFAKMKGFKKYEDPTILRQVLDYVNTKYVFHEDDMETYFLSSSFCVEVMHIIRKNVKDVELADETVRFYERNPNLMVDRGHHLYNSYIDFLIEQGDIHKVMKEYSRLVPNTTVMSKQYDNLFPLIELTEEYQYLQQIGNVLRMLDYYRFQNVIQLFVNQIAKRKYSDDLNDTFCDIADKWVEIRKKSMELTREKLRINMYAGIACGLIKVYLNANQFDKAWDLYAQFSKNRKDFQGMGKVAPINDLAEACLARGLVDKAMEVITFMGDEEMPMSTQLIAKIQNEALKEAK